MGTRVPQFLIGEKFGKHLKIMRYGHPVLSSPLSSNLGWAQVTSHSPDQHGNSYRSKPGKRLHTQKKGLSRLVATIPTENTEH